VGRVQRQEFADRKAGVAISQDRAALMRLAADDEIDFRIPIPVQIEVSFRPPQSAVENLADEFVARSRVIKVSARR
jgi:hypothetical protein